MEPITAVSVIYINVFSIVSGSFLNAASHVKIWNVLLEVDQELSTHFDGKILVKTRNLFVKLLTVHFQPLFVFIWICYGRITDPKYTSSRFGIFLLENVQRYHIGNLVVLMQHLKFSIKTQFDNINEILKMYLNTDVSPTVLDVIRLRKAYVVLLEQMQNFNRVFGKTIFLFFFMGMISYLMCFSSITVSKTGHKLLQTAYYLSMTIINLFTILWMISIIAVTCGNTTRAAKETGPLCYALCVELKRSNNSELYDELLTFARVASSSNPVVSAAGFFNVDHAMLSHIFTMLISYIIVVLQLYR
ncbi:7tm Chemosensory receptor [Popillia japonica]|uniref:Gustatory receptor n=1 Tax=Popillia japonica TaxID=7064 RepID=A0AAW1JZM5_POPJA